MKPNIDNRELFHLDEPRTTPVPLLVEVPHAGLAIPDDVREENNAPFRRVQGDADLYVDQLFQQAPDFGATLLRSNVSRYVVDLNRSPADVQRLTVPDHPDPRGSHPRGVVWRLTTDGTPALFGSLSYERFMYRMRRYYYPYHAILQAELNRLRSRFGHVVVLAAHSMPSGGLGSAFRADIVPGTRGRTSAHGSFIDCVDDYFSANGFAVNHDTPYRGGWTTGHYGRPHEGLHVIQLEINRKLYMNENTCKPLRERFERMQQQCNGLIAALVQKLAS